MIQIKVASLRDWRDADGVKIAICKQLRGYKKDSFDFVMPELAPEIELERALKNKEIKKRDFLKAYVTSLFNNEAVQALRNIKAIESKEVVLLAYEDEEGFNYVNILKILLQEIKFPYKDRRCPFFIQNDTRLRCSEKEFMRRFWEMPTRSPGIKVTVERNFVYDALQCNFGLHPSGARGTEVLRQCEIYKRKTKKFTCKTCFYSRGSDCLKRKKNITDTSSCENYVDEKLKYGSDLEVFKLYYLMYTHGINLSKIYKILVKGSW